MWRCSCLPGACALWGFAISLQRPNRCCLGTKARWFQAVLVRLHRILAARHFARWLQGWLVVLAQTRLAWLKMLQWLGVVFHRLLLCGWVPTTNCRALGHLGLAHSSHSLPAFQPAHWGWLPKPNPWAFQCPTSFSRRFACQYMPQCRPWPRLWPGAAPHRCQGR